MNAAELHHYTPALAVIDSRGLGVRGAAYWREQVGQAATTRATCHVFDAAGHLAEQWDARLSVPALGQCFSLSGKVLASDSVDAGWRVHLFGEADQVLTGWDGRGSQGDIEYDASMRTVAVTEQGRVVERFEYGGIDASAANQCGRVVRHDDPAGTRHMTEYDLSGLSQCEVSHFLKALDSPDWPLDVAARDALLESEPGLVSRWAYSALGDLLSLTDAHGHRRSFSYSVAGQLGQGCLQPANTPAPGQCLVQDIRYNPSGKVERETAGNGVVTLAEYALSDGRLERLSAGMPNAEPLQDLRYTVDPVGNVVQIDDQALPIRYFKNQRIDPQRVYTYDTLGQLISATGWETASLGAVLNYTEEYAYDASSNMTELRHVGAQAFTRRWLIAPDSNRSLIDDDLPVDFPSHFDANGNLQYLQRGQAMTWDLRNQLASVSPVVRENEADDTKRYIYGGGGKRLRKVRTTLTNATTLIAEVRYLPGLELHRRPTGEQYQVLDLEAGRNRVTWILGPDAPDHPLRYHLTDHLGSGTVEVDEQGNVQRREDYYPFGGTASEDHSDQTGAYKTIRYSGKERDATGLYYYGFRYYAPWLNRWINPDPAGAVDGLNFYCFVRNSPMTRWDPDGRNSVRDEDSDSEVDLSFLDDVESVGSPRPGSPAQALEPVQAQQDAAPASTLAEAEAETETAVLARAQENLTTDANLTMPNTAPPPVLLPLASGVVEEGAGAVSDIQEVQAVVPEKKFKCPICGKAYVFRNGLQVHQKTHNKDKHLLCDKCGNFFKNLQTFKYHFSSGVKSLKCEQCGQLFEREQHLRVHLKIHTENKNFSCGLCGKRFTRNSSLTLHKRIHDGVRDFECKVPGCNKTFTTKNYLNFHSESHLIEDSCPYPGCTSRFVYRVNLQKHFRQQPSHRP